MRQQLDEGTTMKVSLKGLYQRTIFKEHFKRAVLKSHPKRPFRDCYLSDR